VYTKSEVDTKVEDDISGAVSVTTNQDGTFVIHVVSKDYTINLNHTHEGMAKLLVDTAANLPDASEMKNDTIYGELDDGEIATIYLGGYPFYGGGGGASSGPVLRRPADGATIDMGQTTSGTVSQTINVKGKSLTQALIIQLTGTGYSFGTTQPSEVTRDSATQLTIPASSISAVNSLNGVDIIVVYTGNDTDENASGTLGITSASPDNISTEATLVANKVTYEDLAAVKMTGTQWINTDYYPNANTEFEFEVKFTPNSHTSENPSGAYYFLYCDNNTTDGKKFMMWNIPNSAGSPIQIYSISFINESDAKYGTNWQQFNFGTAQDISKFTADHTKISYSIGSKNGTLSFVNDSVSMSLDTSKKTSTMEVPVRIGKTGSRIYNAFDLTIYGLKFVENGTTVRNYVPMKRNGVPGLYDTVTGAFFSSETAKTSGLTSDELVAIPLT